MWESTIVKVSSKMNNVESLIASLSFCAITNRFIGFAAYLCVGERGDSISVSNFSFSISDGWRRQSDKKDYPTCVRSIDNGIGGST